MYITGVNSREILVREIKKDKYKTATRKASPAGLDKSNSQ